MKIIQKIKQLFSNPPTNAQKLAQKVKACDYRPELSELSVYQKISKSMPLTLEEFDQISPMMELLVVNLAQLRKEDSNRTKKLRLEGTPEHAEKLRLQKLAESEMARLYN